MRSQWLEVRGPQSPYPVSPILQMVEQSQGAQGTGFLSLSPSALQDAPDPLPQTLQSSKLYFQSTLCHLRDAAWVPGTEAHAECCTHRIPACPAPTRR